MSRSSAAARALAPEARPRSAAPPRPVLVRLYAVLHRRIAALGPTARRRTLKLAAAAIPRIIAIAACVGVALGAFAEPDLRPRHFAVAAALVAALVAAVWRRLRDAAEGRAAGAREQVEIGALVVVTAHAVAQTSGTAGGEPPLYPIVYLAVASLVAFVSRTAALGIVGIAVAVEAAAFWARGSPPAEWPAVAAHGGFILCFALAYHAMLAARIAASRHAERAAIARRLRDIEERAREFRLLSPAGGEGDAAERERRFTEASVLELEAAVRGTLEVAGVALRSHTCALFLLSADDERLVLRECRSPSEAVRRMLPAGEGPLGGVVRRRAAVRLHGPIRSASHYDDATSPRALLAVPLLDPRGGQVRGVLLADRVEDAGFGDQDERLLSTIAAELSRAIASERLMWDMKRTRDEKERFYAAIERLNRMSRPRDVFDAALEVAGGMVPLEFGAVTLVETADSKAIHRVARVSLADGGKSPSGLEGLEFPDNTGLVAAAVRLGSSLPGKELKPGEAVIFDDATRLKGLRSLKVVPLKAGSAVLGTLVLGSRREGAFDADAVRQLEVIAMQAADSVLRARLFEQTERLATTDGLTGLLNHRAFQARLDEQLALALRYGKRLSLILCDIDHFKSVNDTYGHPAGDKVLKGVAKALSREARATDIVARYGGEEFAIVIPETDGAGALAIAERIRDKVARIAFDTELGSLRVTLSLGIATCPEDGRQKSELVEVADGFLYQAKRAGRNRTVSGASPPRHRRATG